MKKQETEGLVLNKDSRAIHKYALPPLFLAVGAGEPRRLQAGRGPGVKGWVWPLPGCGSVSRKGIF